MSERPQILSYATSHAEPFSIEPLGDRIALRYPPESPSGRIVWMWVISLLGAVVVVAAAWSIWVAPAYWWLATVGVLLVWVSFGLTLRDELCRLRAARRGDPSRILYLTSAALRENPTPPRAADLEPCLTVVDIRVCPGPYLLTFRRAMALQLVLDWGDSADLLCGGSEVELHDMARRLRDALKLDDAPQPPFGLRVP